jgi:hypothetical protein
LPSLPLRHQMYVHDRLHSLGVLTASCLQRPGPTPWTSSGFAHPHSSHNIRNLKMQSFTPDCYWKTICSSFNLGVSK